jgi:hypothetical protein
MTEVPIARHPVQSSTILSVGYTSGVLEVEFKSGGVYRYNGVTPDIYQQLMESESVGKAFHSLIKNKFEHVKIPATTEEKP